MTSFEQHGHSTIVSWTECDYDQYESMYMSALL